MTQSYLLGFLRNGPGSGCGLHVKTLKSRRFSKWQQHPRHREVAGAQQVSGPDGAARARPRALSWAPSPSSGPPPRACPRPPLSRGFADFLFWTQETLCRFTPRSSGQSLWSHESWKGCQVLGQSHASQRGRITAPNALARTCVMGRATWA